MKRAIILYSYQLLKNKLCFLFFIIMLVFFTLRCGFLFSLSLSSVSCVYKYYLRSLKIKLFTCNTNYTWNITCIYLHFLKNFNIFIKHLLKKIFPHLVGLKKFHLSGWMIENIFKIISMKKIYILILKLYEYTFNKIHNTYNKIQCVLPLILSKTLIKHLFILCVYNSKLILIIFKM